MVPVARAASRVLPQPLAIGRKIIGACTSWRPIAEVGDVADPKEARRPALSRAPLATDIVIVTWNGREDTLRALEAIAPQIGSRPAGVIVVDNGSSDGVGEAIRERSADTRVVRLEENRGFTGGVAAGIEASKADAVILLNNDAIPQPGWLEALTRRLETSDDDVIAAGGRIVDSTGTLADFVRGVMTFDGHAFQPGFRMPLSQAHEPEDGSEILFACGGNMIVRRREFIDLGGFDQDYFAYLEDVDFGWRAWLSGYRIVYDTTAVVRHKSAATSDRLGAYERGVLFEKNALQTVMKNYEDELLREAAGPIFLTFLHRLHQYSTSRNGDASGLLVPPIGEKTGRPRGRIDGSRLSRLRRSLGRRVAARRHAVVIDDPLTMMQFRAAEWFFANMDRIAEKRERVQKRRKRSDSEIFRRFPLHYVPTYEGDDELMGSRLFEILKPGIASVTKTLADMMKR